MIRLTDFVSHVRECSKSEAKRLIIQNAVSVNGERVSDFNAELNGRVRVRVGNNMMGKVFDVDSEKLAVVRGKAFILKMTENEVEAETTPAIPISRWKEVVVPSYLVTI